MKNLYIIGNGFDRFHHLKTSYQHFGFFLQENYTNLYDDLIKYYGLPDIDPDDEENYNDPLWSDFENALAELEFETILDENTGYLPDYGSDEFRDRDNHVYQQVMEGIVGNLTSGLCNAFNEFILNVEFPDSVNLNLLSIKDKSLFFNFNYTDTLEKYYKIDRTQILYIHNKAKTIENNIILGHGVNPDEFKTAVVEQPEGLTDEQLEGWLEDMSGDYAYETGKEELISYFEKSFKPTNEIIDQNKLYLNGLSDIKDVYVFGHSLSPIDLPYFEEIKKSITTDAKWHVSFYYTEEIITHTATLINMGIKQENIEMIELKNLLMNIGQK